MLLLPRRCGGVREHLSRRHSRTANDLEEEEEKSTNSKSQRTNHHPRRNESESNNTKPLKITRDFPRSNKIESGEMKKWKWKRWRQQMNRNCWVSDRGARSDRGERERERLFSLFVLVLGVFLFFLFFIFWLFCNILALFLNVFGLRCVHIIITPIRGWDCRVGVLYRVEWWKWRKRTCGSNASKSKAIINSKASATVVRYWLVSPSCSHPTANFKILNLFSGL